MLKDFVDGRRKLERKAERTEVTSWAEACGYHIQSSKYEEIVVDKKVSNNKTNLRDTRQSVSGKSLRWEAFDSTLRSSCVTLLCKCFLSFHLLNKGPQGEKETHALCACFSSVFPATPHGNKRSRKVSTRYASGNSDRDWKPCSLDFNEIAGAVFYSIGHFLLPLVLLTFWYWNILIMRYFFTTSPLYIPVNVAWFQTSHFACITEGRTMENNRKIMKRAENQCTVPLIFPLEMNLSPQSRNSSVFSQPFSHFIFIRFFWVGSFDVCVKTC